MRLFRITLFLFLATLFSACIGEWHNKYCPTDRNVVVEFAYVYNGNDVFNEQVESVDLFVFDSNNLLVHRETINAAQLNAFAGTDLSHLAPGTYRIVAWGNVSPLRNTFGGANVGDNISDAHIGRVGVTRNTESQSGNSCRLHFAPGLAQNQFTITVPTSGDLTATLPFARSYIGIEVFVVGFAAYTNQTEPPIIEINGAASHFCFNRNPEGNITLRETTVIQTQYVERPAVAMFRTKLFDNNTGFAKELHVRSGQAGNAIHYTINDVRLRQLVAQFMASNNITSLKADATPQRVIPITISFEDGENVSVTVDVKDFELVEIPPMW